MINHMEQFEKVRNTYEELEEGYKIFKKKTSYVNRNLLKAKINNHRKALSDLMLSINNLFLK